MSFSSSVRFASIADSNITQVTPSASLAAIDPEYVAITHPAIALTTNPEVFVDNVAITFTAIGSGGDYEAKRISETQTIIKIKNRGLKTIAGYPVPNPIGDAIVGSTFIIE